MVVCTEQAFVGPRVRGGVQTVLRLVSQREGGEGGEAGGAGCGRGAEPRPAPAGGGGFGRLLLRRGAGSGESLREKGA
jgi:hypothetical protein